LDVGEPTAPWISLWKSASDVIGIFSSHWSCSIHLFSHQGNIFAKCSGIAIFCSFFRSKSNSLECLHKNWESLQAYVTSKKWNIHTFNYLPVKAWSQFDQPSTINHQPSTINHQPSTINHQPDSSVILSEVEGSLSTNHQPPPCHPERSRRIFIHKPQTTNNEQRTTNNKPRTTNNDPPTTIQISHKMN
jgi:hypothetical protein